MTKPKFADLGDLPEDKRIDLIGHQVMDHSRVVGFIVEDEAGKAERYLSKLKERYPRIRVVYQGKGPVANTVLIKVAPPTGDEGK